MRTQILVVVSVLLTSVAGAQTQKGNGLIGGSVSVNYSRNDYQQTTFYSSNSRNWQPALNLTAGRFVADNWLVGLSVTGTSSFGRSITQSGQQQPETRKARNVAVTTTPFVRRYWQFAPVFIYAGAGLSAGVNGERQSYQAFDVLAQPFPVSERTHDVSVNPYLEAGLTYFLTNRLALDLTATAGSLPFGVGGFGTGLVYWTGSNRTSAVQSPRENPQTNQGNWIVEGSFSVSGSGNRRSEGAAISRSTVGQYTISPSVGYFVHKNDVLGISIPVAFGNSESNGQNSPASSGNNFWTVGIAPYYQHYWSSTRLTPYTRVNAAYLISGSKATDNPTRIVSSGLGIGLAYMAGQRFIIETSVASASFVYVVPAGSDATTQSWSTSLSAGLGGSFSVRYVLTGTK